MVADCTKALEYNNKYTKALFRRAKACEITNDLMQCLEGQYQTLVVLVEVKVSSEITNDLMQCLEGQYPTLVVLVEVRFSSEISDLMQCFEGHYLNM